MQSETRVVHNDGDIQPLITAEQTFPAMEKLILDACRSLDLALHVFSPRTKTRSSEAHTRRLTDWGELLADALARNVKIRLLLNDFDPVGAPEMHATVWERIGQLGEAMTKLSAEQRNGFELRCVHPGGQSGGLLRTLVWPVARAKQKAMIEEFRDKGRPLPPGLAGRDGKADVPLWPPRRNYTQTLHQKFIMVDGKQAIIGGLDIDERRYDDPDHQRDGPQTWHDVSVAVTGPAVASLGDHFQRCWQLAVEDGHSHAPAFRAAHPHFPVSLDRPAKDGKNMVRETVHVDAHGSIAVATTLPRPGSNPLRFGPKADVRALEAAHLTLFNEAGRLIYLESQFFRSSTIRDGLIAALGENPELHVILLLPGAPEVIAYQGEESAVHRYGEWLQMRALNRLTRLFPNRFAAFSLTSDRTRQEEVERDALYDKSMVYVHSKLAIADDKTAIVSSANLNGRSMQWDVEAGIVARRADFATELRRQLWRAHLGGETAVLDPAADPGGAFTYWRQAAQTRARQGADAKGTGVVPFPLQKTKRFAKRHMLIPEQIV